MRQREREQEQEQERAQERQSGRAEGDRALDSGAEPATQEGPGPGGHGHSHERGPLQLDPDRIRRARGLLFMLVVPLIVATVAGLAWLWPRGETIMGTIPFLDADATFESGVIVEVTGTPGAEMDVEVTTGDRAGQVVSVQVPPEVMDAGPQVGAKVRLFYVERAAATGSPFIFHDYAREIPILWLAAAYLLAVGLVARWRGLAAVLGLGASLTVVGVFVLPALVLGTSPLLVALVGSSAMLLVSLYLAHGISIRTTTALLGTFAGLGITTLVAWWSTGAANLVGNGSEAAYMVATTFPSVNLSSLLLCGIVVASLGALNDVTITQASAVWEIHASDPTQGRRRVFTRAMRIGKDHIASTVYTLAFAYVGTALPMLMLTSIYAQPFGQWVTSGEVAEEVVRTLVSSIGLVLAIPITTGISALLVGSATPERGRGPLPASAAP